MRYSTKQYAKALYESLEEAAKGQEKKVISDFANVLFKHKRLNQMKDIVATLEEIELEKNGKINVRVKTTNEPEAKKVIESIRGDIKARSEIDPSLIAGTEITVGDTRVTSSFKSRLSDLRKAISQ